MSVSIVFEDILDKAVRHNDAENPEIKVDVEEKSKTVCIIFDNGSGIPEPKEQFLKPGGIGDRGMGLYLVNQLINRYGGELILTDHDPRGTIAAVELKKPAGTGYSNKLEEKYQP